MRARRAHGRVAGDDGAAIVEFAIVLPVLMILLLGLFSGATAWNQNQALGQGARVAGRFASTLPLPETDAERDAWLDDIAARAVASAEGRMGASTPGRTICVAYVDPVVLTPDDAIARRTTGNGTPTSSSAACYDDGLGDTAKRVQVVLTRDGALDIGFYRMPLTLRSHTVYRYEADSGI